MFSHTKPPAGTQINPLHPLSRGLVGFWLFNEGAGSLANDISGNKNHGRLKNMAPNTQGSGWGGSKFGGGLKFDGVDDYVDAGNDVSLDMGSGPFTIELWLNSLTNTEAFSTVLDKSDNNDWTDIGVKTGFWLAYRDVNNLLFCLGDGTSTGYTSPDSVVFGDLRNTGRKHLTITVDDGGDTTPKIVGYMDGIQVDITDRTLTGSVNSPQDLNIGQWRWLTYNFNGAIGPVLIYNRALSAEEITWSYREPYAMFEPAFNPSLLYSAAPPVGAIMNQFQKTNIGADLYNGVFA